MIDSSRTIRPIPGQGTEIPNMKEVYYAQAEITRSGSSESGSSVRIAPRVRTQPENTNQRRFESPFTSISDVPPLTCPFSSVP